MPIATEPPSISPSRSWAGTGGSCTLPVSSSTIVTGGVGCPHHRTCPCPSLGCPLPLSSPPLWCQGPSPVALPSRGP